MAAREDREASELIASQNPDMTRAGEKAANLLPRALKYIARTTIFGTGALILAALAIGVAPEVKAASSPPVKTGSRTNHEFSLSQLPPSQQPISEQIAQIAAASAITETTDFTPSKLASNGNLVGIIFERTEDLSVGVALGRVTADGALDLQEQSLGQVVPHDIDICSSSEENELVVVSGSTPGNSRIGTLSFVERSDSQEYKISKHEIEGGPLLEARCKLGFKDTIYVVMGDPRAEYYPLIHYIFDRRTGLFTLQELCEGCSATGFGSSLLSLEEPSASVVFAKSADPNSGYKIGRIVNDRLVSLKKVRPEVGYLANKIASYIDQDGNLVFVPSENWGYGIEELGNNPRAPFGTAHKDIFDRSGKFIESEVFQPRSSLYDNKTVYIGEMAVASFAGGALRAYMLTGTQYRSEDRRLVYYKSYIETIGDFDHLESYRSVIRIGDGLELKGGPMSIEVIQNQHIMAGLRNEGLVIYRLQDNGAQISDRYHRALLKSIEVEKPQLPYRVNLARVVSN